MHKPCRPARHRTRRRRIVRGCSAQGHPWSVGEASCAMMLLNVYRGGHEEITGKS